VGGVDAFIADALIAHSINLIRLQGGFIKAVQVILDDLEADLVKKLTDGRELTSFGRQRLLDLLAETRSMIASAHIDARAAVDIDGLAQVEAQFTRTTVAAAIADKLTVGLPNAAVMRALASEVLIQGAPSADWWARQAGDTAFRFAGAIRTGVAQGETNAQIVARVRGKADMPGVIEVSRRNAEALVRSSVQTVANTARLEVFKANADVINGVRQLSTLDGRTTDICVAYSGGQWDLEGKPLPGTKLPFNGGPPRHWNCRSVLSPIVAPIKGLDFGPTTRASMDGPVSADLSFADWLQKKPAAFADDLLGKGRAQLWRDKKITLAQLLDQRGRPLTLAELQEKYGGQAAGRAAR